MTSSLVTSTLGWADSGPAREGEAPPAAEESAAAAVGQATSPLPTTNQLSIAPGYTFPNGRTRYIAQLSVQPVLHYKGFFVPDLDVPAFSSLARIQVSGLSVEQTAPIGTISASGLSDLSFADAVVHVFGPLTVGTGFVGVFPMATDPALGQGKLQLGPAAALGLLNIPWLQVAAEVHVLWSVAGDSRRSSLAYATVQPTVAVLLPAACAVFTNDVMSFYWEGTGTTVPVNLGFGHGFSKHFVGQVQSGYVLSGAGKGGIQGLVVLNFQ